MNIMRLRRFFSFVASYYEKIVADSSRDTLYNELYRMSLELWIKSKSERKCQLLVFNKKIH